MKASGFLAWLLFILILVIVGYWYLVPLQLWYALIGQTSLGASIGFLATFILTVIVGTVISVVFAVLAFVCWG